MKEEIREETASELTIPQMLRQMKAQNIDRRVRIAWLMNYFEKKSRLGLIPLHGVFELTPMCNLDCRMCYVHLEQYDPQQLLPVESWIWIISEARKLGMMDATLTGGECLTYPGFDAIYIFLFEHGIRPGILSNGLLIDDERIAFFKRYPPKGIKITLYGSDEDAYEAVTGHRVYAQVKENIERLRDAGLPVMVSITPNDYMLDDSRILIRTMESFDIRNEINFALLTPRKETGRERAEASEDRIIELYRARREYRKIQTVLPDPCEVPYPNQEASGEALEGILCGAGRSSFTILHDGSMSPCAGLHCITTRPMKQGFPAAWRELCEKMKHYPRPMECEGCEYRGVCMPCLALHQAAPRGHCDKRICERIHRMAMEGLISLNGRKNEEWKARVTGSPS